MKRSKYKEVYNYSYSTSSKKAIRKRVKKYFMTSKEFLGIYNICMNIHSVYDFKFAIRLIESSNTYRHYKKVKLYLTDFGRRVTIEECIIELKNCNNKLQIQLHKDLFNIIIQWLFSYTVHDSSLNSVTFK